MRCDFATFGAIVLESVIQESCRGARGGSSLMVLQRKASKLGDENGPDIRPA